MNKEYIKRINTILIYIDNNLDADLSLETISQIAFYSPYHLHRIFRAITNETMNAYIIRKRIEKTAALLIHRKEMAITEMALQYGFNSVSVFSRTFKKYYGQSPTEFRKSNPRKFSKIGKLDSKISQEQTPIENYLCNIETLKKWITMNAKIEIKEMPKMDLAYITQIGVAGLEDAFARLIRWATPKNLSDNPRCKVARIYHDSFKFTTPDQVRMSVCILLDEPIEVSDEVGLTTINKGKFIVGHFEIEPKDFEKSWSSLFIWMNEKGYKKANQNPFEIIHNNFNDHPEKKCIVDLYIPVESHI